MGKRFQKPSKTSHKRRIILIMGKKKGMSAALWGNIIAINTLPKEKNCEFCSFSSEGSGVLRYYCSKKHRYLNGSPDCADFSAKGRK